MDFVVATRFHNVLLSLELGVPCVSLSHMEKNDELMTSLGLSRFRVTLRTATLDALVDAFTRLQAERLTVRAAIEARKPALREALDAQYTLIRERILARVAPEAGAKHHSGRR